MPTPPPMSRQPLRCFLVAFRNRGNHSKGTLISRPSARATRKAEVVTRTSVAKGLNFILSFHTIFLPSESLEIPRQTGCGHCYRGKRRFPLFRVRLSRMPRGSVKHHPEHGWDLRPRGRRSVHPGAPCRLVEDLAEDRACLLGSAAVCQRVRRLGRVWRTASSHSPDRAGPLPARGRRWEGACCRTPGRQGKMNSLLERAPAFSCNRMREAESSKPVLRLARLSTVSWAASC
jgi:hypothetical protein